MNSAETPQLVFLNRDRLQLDSVPDRVHSDVPDKVHSDSAKTKAPKPAGDLVSVRDVLEHKDSDEIWVVIKGEVYE